MKIYTKKGDTGQTVLIGGSKVNKDHLRINAYGTVDELNAYLGLLRDLVTDSTIATHLLKLQDRLFVMGALLAEQNGGSNMKLPQLNEQDIVFLEEQIDAMEMTLPQMTHFILPGGHVIVSHCHIARCVCRRAERTLVSLQQQEDCPAICLQYLNRLSDYLFVLSRFLSQKLNAEELIWKAAL